MISTAEKSRCARASAGRATAVRASERARRIGDSSLGDAAIQPQDGACGRRAAWCRPAEVGLPPFPRAQLHSGPLDLQELDSSAVSIRVPHREPVFTQRLAYSRLAPTRQQDESIHRCCSLDRALLACARHRGAGGRGAGPLAVPGAPAGSKHRQRACDRCSAMKRRSSRPRRRPPRPRTYSTRTTQTPPTTGRNRGWPGAS